MIAYLVTSKKTFNGISMTKYYKGNFFIKVGFTEHNTTHHIVTKKNTKPSCTFVDINKRYKNELWCVTNVSEFKH